MWGENLCLVVARLLFLGFSLLYLCSQALQLPEKIIISTLNPVDIFNYCLTLRYKSSDNHSGATSEIPTIYSCSMKSGGSLYFCFMWIYNPWRASKSFILHEPIESSFIEYLVYSRYAMALCHEDGKKWHEIGWKSWKYICLDIHCPEIVCSIYP